jgi:hypothetical protein
MFSGGVHPITCPVGAGGSTRTADRRHSRSSVSRRKYLAQFALAHGCRLATFDQAMAKLHYDVAELVPDS